MPCVTYGRLGQFEVIFVIFKSLAHSSSESAHPFRPMVLACIRFNAYEYVCVLNNKCLPLELRVAKLYSLIHALRSKEARSTCKYAPHPPAPHPPFFAHATAANRVAAKVGARDKACRPQSQHSLPGGSSSVLAPRTLEGQARQSRAVV